MTESFDLLDNSKIHPIKCRWLIDACIHIINISSNDMFNISCEHSLRESSTAGTSTTRSAAFVPEGAAVGDLDTGLIEGSLDAAT